jgi:hypothetical protein
MVRNLCGDGGVENFHGVKIRDSLAWKGSAVIFLWINGLIF